MAQKEILGLEAKVFHAKKDVRMNVDDTRTGRMQYVPAIHNSQPKGGFSGYCLHLSASTQTNLN